MSQIATIFLVHQPVMGRLAVDTVLQCFIACEEQGISEDRAEDGRRTFYEVIALYLVIFCLISCVF